MLHLSTTYIHCRKHFPKTDGAVEWGTDDPRAKGGDYFGAKDTPVALGALSHEGQRRHSPEATKT